LNDVSLPVMFALLALLLLASAFFSGSETALMSLNRYRLRHMAKSGHRGALLAQRLLDRPDRLIGLILLGNNFVNISASAIATILAIRLGGEAGILIGTAILTVVVLIFSEVAPKTIAAYHPERIGFAASYVLWPLLRVTQPVVWSVSMLANGVLRAVGVRKKRGDNDQLSPEELRTLLAEGGGLIRPRDRRMLLNILELEELAVDEIMVPRREVQGIDLDEDPAEVLAAIGRFPYSRIPIYRGSVDRIFGVVNTRQILPLLAQGTLNVEALERGAKKPYFIPSGTPLTRQLQEFQRRERRMGFVVDEYGDLQGLITIQDILEEIVGEFTTGPDALPNRALQLPDGNIRAEGRMRVRLLNRQFGWTLPTDGASTLSGLIVEQMDGLPEQGSEAEVLGLRMQFERVDDNLVQRVLILPPTAA
jgi:Mg2+/Co2+ transporter CorB